MYQKGELDATVAMQLLGGVGSATNSDVEGDGDKNKENTKKRPLDAVTPANPPQPSDHGGSLDEVLEQAKRAKMESCFCIFKYILFDLELYHTLLDLLHLITKNKLTLCF